MRSSAIVLALIATLTLATSASATVVDLSAAVSGTLITGVNASFAQTFDGQTVSGIGIVGSPNDPLTLAPSATITVHFFNGENTLLPQPNNQGPLSCLLDVDAFGAISWTMGSASPPSSVDVEFYDANGNVVHAVNVPLISGYNTYAFNVPAIYRGFTIFNDNDPLGLRYYAFEYRPAALPTEVATWGGVKALYK